MSPQYTAHHALAFATTWSDRLTGDNYKYYSTAPFTACHHQAIPSMPSTPSEWLPLRAYLWKRPRPHLSQPLQLEVHDRLCSNYLATNETGQQTAHSPGRQRLCRTSTQLKLLLSRMQLAVFSCMPSQIAPKPSRSMLHNSQAGLLHCMQQRLQLTAHWRQQNT
jgi:hypothetical protein